MLTLNPQRGACLKRTEVHLYASINSRRNYILSYIWAQVVRFG